jgi:GMP synthase-like glutamine amidotransferase
MRIVSLMHVPFEDAANLGVWATQRGHTVEAVHLYEGQTPPPASDIDAAFVMGGPMNVYEAAEYPWLDEEKKFLASCIAADKILVGVCLGGQLIADVLGGKVTRNAHKEIGWYEVTRTHAAGGSLLDGTLPERFWAFHWHGDMFSIPPDATHLAFSRACANQAFLFGRKILGLQFHLEYSRESIEAMLMHCDDELTKGRFIQSSEQIRDGFKYLPEAKNLLWNLLDRLFDTRLINP